MTPSTSTAPSAIAIETRGLSQVFLTKSGPVHALEEIDLRVRQGEFVSIVGPSGCGKSTLLRLVAGLQPHTFGDVEYEGRTVTKPQTDIGVVFQGDALLEWRSAIDNVLLQVDMRRRRTPADVDRAHALLESVGLGGFEKSLPHQLSGGMRQRVAICRALIHEPPVLLMDEPFGALDALTREQMMVDLQALWASNGMSVLFITHSIPEAVFLSDRVVVMASRPGRVIEEIAIDAPRPRSLDLLGEPEFVEVAARIRSLLGGRPE
jgi:NitT/TauT family transport system ATP-binding protein